MESVPSLLLAELFTDANGRAKFRDIRMPLGEGSPVAALSALTQSSGHQFRMSPVGFESKFHCSTIPQWLIVLSGAMEIGLQDGSSRIFKAGQCFYSNDTLPAGAVFDASLHGHWSAQVGDEPLITVFIRA